jgi:CRP/FNR family transcriptional regulator, cyclic AMP receptor protein
MEIARIKAAPLFADVADDDLATLAAVATEATVEAGATVVREGDFGYTAFLVEDGTAEVVKGGAVVATIGPGDMFGEIAGQQSGRRVADVRATSAMKLIVVMNRDLWRVQERLPHIAAAIRRTAQERHLANRLVADAELAGEAG